MAIIDRDDTYPDEDRYWNVVSETLTQVFKLDPHTVNQLVDRFRRRMAESPASQKLLFYHSEPLDVAADLVRERPNPNQINTYMQLTRQLYWVRP